MTKDYHTLAIIVMVILSLLAPACTPQQMAAIQFALKDAVIYLYGEVYYGVIYVFGAIFYAEVVPGEGVRMSIYQVDQTIALERVKLLQKLGATRLCWSTVPTELRNEVWARIQKFGGGGGLGTLTILVVPVNAFDALPMMQPDNTTSN